MAFAERLCIKNNQNGVQLLATQKPIKRPGWWEAKLVLFWMLATLGGVGNRGPPVQRSTSSPPPTPDYQGARTFRGQELLYTEGQGWGGVATCQNITVISDSHLEIGHAVV